jgi:hypothetical protein
MIQRLQQRYNVYNKDKTITTKIQQSQQRYNYYNKDTTFTTDTTITIKIQLLQ